MTTTNHLPSASAVGVTNNQPKENAITTITDTQVATKSPFNFVPDTDVNQRLKIARMAKEFSTYGGVFLAEVGTLHITEKRPNQDAHTYQVSELVRVKYGIDCAIANRAAGQPFTVTSAYFTREEQLFAVVFTEANDPIQQATFHYFRPNSNELFGVGGNSVTVGDVTYPCRGGGDRNLGDVLAVTIGSFGNQLRVATSIIAKRDEAVAAEAVHQAKIAEAYATKPEWHSWKLGVVLREVEAVSDEVFTANRATIKDALKALTTALEVELHHICASSVGLLRCEVRISGLVEAYSDDYGWVTLAEVERYILRRWVTDAWADQVGIRTYVATEFIRRNF